MAAKKPENSRTSFHLALPATSANLGPAFDAAALAFNLHLKLEARRVAEYSIQATGRDAGICGQVENHLILTTYREVLQSAGRTPEPLALRIHNEIPIGKGCGSSAAARLAGIALAVHYGNLGWTDAQIVGEASRREHHPDNASACWMGGLTVARMSGEAEAQVARIQPKGKWPLLFAVPPEPLSTEKARRVLPAHYARADAVINIQNSMLLLAAFLQGKPELLRSALEDRIHQPYRARLCPLLPAVQEMAGMPGVLGAVLSGAGPSALIFLDPHTKMPAKKIAAQVAAHLKQKRLIAELILTSIAAKGATVTRRANAKPGAVARATKNLAR
jgi:homoserine kinase